MPSFFARPTLTTLAVKALELTRLEDTVVGLQLASFVLTTCQKQKQQRPLHDPRVCSMFVGLGLVRICDFVSSASLLRADMPKSKCFKS